MGQGFKMSYKILLNMHKLSVQQAMLLLYRAWNNGQQFSKQNIGFPTKYQIVQNFLWKDVY